MPEYGMTGERGVSIRLRVPFFGWKIEKVIGRARARLCVCACVNRKIIAVCTSA